MTSKYVSPIRSINRRESDIGTERQCTCCRGFWPEDAEFYPTKLGRFLPECRACTYDRKARERQGGGRRAA